MAEAYLCITIDTEVDKSPDWKASRPPAYRSVLHGIPELLHPLFREFGAEASYLLSPEVVENAECVQALLSLSGAHELGTHLHADFIQPMKRHQDYGGKDSDDFQTDYPPEVEFQKLENLTRLFQVAFGRPPRVFRAGRFAANGNTIRSLARLGYLVDTSVTPHMTWRNRDGKELSHVGAPTQPYFTSGEDIRAAGEGGVLEVPVTILPAFTLLGSLRNLRPKYRLDWLRPFWSSGGRMKRIVDRMLAGPRPEGPLVLNMMFHSMEVIPGASPYPQSAEEVRKYLDSLRMVLDHCRRRGVGFSTLEGIHQVYRKARTG